MLRLHGVIALLQVVAVGLLLFDVLHLGVGVCSFLGQPVGIGEDCGLQSGHLLFEFKKRHFRYSPFHKI